MEGNLGREEAVGLTDFEVVAAAVVDLGLTVALLIFVEVTNEAPLEDF